MTRQLPIHQPFDLALSLTMGQAFRWHELPPDFYGGGHKWFSGVLGENLIHIRQTENGLEYRVGNPNGERTATAEDDDMLRRYFRDDDDTAAIYADISNRDSHIAELVREYSGMRVLRQEPWECMVSYICSANNSIKGVSRCVEALSNEFGRQVTLGDESRLAFPLPWRLAEATDARLRELKLGFRAPRVVLAARRVADAGINLTNFVLMPYRDAKARLMQYDGIGPKVADCIALMSLDKLEAFPVDTHIRKLVNERWFGWEKPPPDYEIVQWSRGYFGPYSGYAGQFIFCDRAQAGNRAAASASRRKVQGTAKSRSASFEDHRARQCPFCGAPPGSHCKTPGGHYLLQGHSDRRSPVRRTIRNARRRRSPGSVVRRRRR